MKINTRIISTILICSLLMALLVSGFSIFLDKNIIEKEARENILSNTQLVSAEIDETLISYKSNILSFKNFIEGSINQEILSNPDLLKSFSNNNLAASSEKFIESTENCAGAYIAFDYNFTGTTEGVWSYLDLEGNLITGRPDDLSKMPKDDPSTSWYYKPIESQKSLWTDIYINNIGLEVISFQAPLFFNKNPIGAIGVDIESRLLTDLIVDEHIVGYDNSFYVLTSKNFKFLTKSPSECFQSIDDISSKNFEQIKEKLNDQGHGLIRLDLCGVDSFLSFTKLADGKILFSSVPRSNIFAGLRSTIGFLLVVVLLSSILVFIISLFLARRISRPIEIITDILNRTSTLDLRNIEKTEEVENIFLRKDELGEMVLASEKLRDEFRNMLTVINDTINHLKGNIDELNLSTAETNEAIGTVHHTINELADVTNSQAKDTHLGAEELTVLAEEIKQAVEFGSSVTGSSKKVYDLNEEGLSIMEAMIDKFKEVSLINTDLANDVNSLQEKSILIMDILTTILNISEKTHLLALNSSIEASRAGEAGRGFSVVAEQIRTLSNETAESAKNIEILLKDISTKILETQEKMTESEGSIDILSKSLASTKKSSLNVHTNLGSIISGIESLNSNLDKIDTNKNEVVSAITDISTSSEEIASSNENLSATMEEQMAIVESMTSSFQDLSDLVNVLADLFNRFKL